MRQLRLRPEKLDYFTIDEFQDSRTYAGTVEKLGRVYLLTWSDRRDSWDFMVFTDHTATRGINLFGLRNLPASEALRRFAEQYGPVYEFKTAHEFFTWAAEVTA